MLVEVTLQGTFNFVDEQNNDIHENWCSNIDETTVTLFPVLYIHNKIIISMDTVVFFL